MAKDGAKFAAAGEKLNVGALGLKLKPDRGGGGGGGGTGVADCSSSQLSAMVIWGVRSANSPGPSQSRSAAGFSAVFGAFVTQHMSRSPLQYVHIRKTRYQVYPSTTI